MARGIDKDKAHRIGDEILAALGLYVVDVELELGRSRPIVRYFIDTPQEPLVTIEQCASANRALQSWFDEEQPLGDRYVMEVSSPGIERRIARPRDYARFQGRRVHIKLREVMDGRRHLEGLIGEQNELGFQLVVGDTALVIAFDQVARANLTYDFSPAEE